MGLGKLRHYSRRRRFPKVFRAHRHAWQHPVYEWGDPRRVKLMMAEPMSTLTEVLGG